MCHFVFVIKGLKKRPSTPWHNTCATLGEELVSQIGSRSQDLVLVQELGGEALWAPPTVWSILWLQAEECVACQGDSDIHEL